jgi:hypothetical protein
MVTNNRAWHTQVVTLPHLELAPPGPSTQAQVASECRGRSPGGGIFACAAGEPLSRVALTTGFADRSHLPRHFRRIVGVPRGRYARAIGASLEHE